MMGPPINFTLSDGRTLISHQDKRGEYVTIDGGVSIRFGKDDVEQAILFRRDDENFPDALARILEDKATH